MTRGRNRYLENVVKVPLSVSVWKVLQTKWTVTFTCRKRRPKGRLTTLLARSSVVRLVITAPPLQEGNGVRSGWRHRKILGKYEGFLPLHT